MNRLRLFQLVVILSSCGTLVGNPKKPNPTPGPQFVEYQLVDFTVPPTLLTDKDASLKLAGETNLTAFQLPTLQSLLALRIELNVYALNAAIEYLKSQAKVLGKFTNKGEGGKYSGVVSVADGVEYTYAATLCYEGKKALFVKWEKSGKRVYGYYDASVVTFGDREEPLINAQTEIFSEKNNGERTARIHGQGEYKVPSFLKVDGPYALETAIGRNRADGVTEVRSVNDWSSERQLNADGQGDEYITGVTDAQGDSSFVAYQKLLPACSKGFDESDSKLFEPTAAFGAAKGFCVGKVGNQGRDVQANYFKAKLPDLKAIGIVRKSELKMLAFPAEAAECPR
jgi:hypothetical protein